MSDSSTIKIPVGFQWSVTDLLLGGYEQLINDLRLWATHPMHTRTEIAQRMRGERL